MVGVIRAAGHHRAHLPGASGAPAALLGGSVTALIARHGVGLRFTTHRERNWLK